MSVHVFYALRMAAWRLVTGRQLGHVGTDADLPRADSVKLGTQAVTIDPLPLGGKERWSLWETSEQPYDGPGGTMVVWALVDSEVR